MLASSTCVLSTLQLCTTGISDTFGAVALVFAMPHRCASLQFAASVWQANHLLVGTGYLSVDRFLLEERWILSRSMSMLTVCLPHHNAAAMLLLRCAPQYAGVELAHALEGTATTSRLQTLYLNENALGDATAAALGSALAAQGACGTLRTLDLSDNPISSTGAAALAASGVRAGATPLLTLGLQRIGSFGLDAAAAFGLALGGDIGGRAATEENQASGGRRGLRLLQLDKSGIDDACLAELARAGVFRSTSLEVLSVECYYCMSDQESRVTVQGVLALVEAAARDRFGVDLSDGASCSSAGGDGAPAAAGCASAGHCKMASSPAAAAVGTPPLLPLEIKALRSVPSHHCDAVRALEARINAAFVIPDAEDSSCAGGETMMSSAANGEAAGRPSWQKTKMFQVSK